MPPDIRAKFDRVMSGLWHEDCECWRFIFEGKIKEVTQELNDDDRWAILGVVERGEALPVKPQTGSGY